MSSTDKEASSEVQVLKSSNRKSAIRFYVVIIMLVWLLVGVSLFIREIWMEEAHIYETALQEAISSHRKDLAVRMWVAEHGGIYVPVTEKTPPNPHLSHVFERDLKTPSGRNLTLMNPAYVMRQVLAKQAEYSSSYGKLTSLKVFNPNNAPDAWERETLLAFEKGHTKKSEMTEIDGSKVLRYMEPLYTKKNCLKCHAKQGYKVGDVRGALGVVVPVAPIEQALHSKSHFYSLAILWCIGLLCVGVIVFRLNQQERKRLAMESDLADANIQLNRSLEKSERREQQLNAITSASPDYIIMIDTDLRIKYINKAIDGTDRTEYIGLPLYTFVAENDQNRVHSVLRRVIDEGVVAPYHSEYATNGKKVLKFDSVAAPMWKKGRVTGGIIVARDVTEKQFLETQLRQRQKLDALGQLAGGVAHDINNLLYVIQGYGDLLQQDLASYSEWSGKLNKLLDATDKAASIIEKLLEISSVEFESHHPISIITCIENQHEMLTTILGEHIELHIEAEDADLMLQVDEAQLSQVLINLCTNARDAMPDGGRVDITLKETTIKPHMIDVYPWTVEGKGVLLEFKDSGVGMSEDVSSRVFDPFFTTKEVGKGTGIGMASVYTIVKRNKGIISVDSELGKGTVFSVIWPVKSHLSPKKEDRALAKELGGTETILLVEDNDSVREVMFATLVNAGYQVLVARDGKEALDLYGENSSRIQLVIADMIMPKMGGRRLYRYISEQDSHIRILFITGYAASAEDRAFLEKGCFSNLRKPIKRSVLLTTVRQILEQEK